MKHRGSIEGERNLAPISALPLNYLAAKELTGSGRHFGSATEIANSNWQIAINLPLAFGSWLQATTKAKAGATARAKILPLIHGEPGQVAQMKLIGTLRVVVRPLPGASIQAKTRIKLSLRGSN